MKGLYKVETCHRTDQNAGDLVHVNAANAEQAGKKALAYSRKYPGGYSLGGFYVKSVERIGDPAL